MGIFARLSTPRVSAVPPAPPVETPSAWKRPVAELEERMDYLEQSIHKLRGIVTGAQRRRGADPEGAQSSEVDRKPDIAPQQGSPPADRWIALKEAKERKRGLLQG